MADTVAIAVVERGHLQSRLPSQADTPKVESRKVATLIARPCTSTGHGPRDGVAVMKAPVSRRPRGCHEEAQTKGRPVPSLDVIRSTATGRAKALYVNISRFTMSGP